MDSDSTMLHALMNSSEQVARWRRRWAISFGFNLAFVTFIPTMLLWFNFHEIPIYFLVVGFMFSFTIGLLFFHNRLVREENRRLKEAARTRVLHEAYSNGLPNNPFGSGPCQ